MKITHSLVQKSMAKSPWDLGNQVLYDLCSNHPYHKSNEEIIAKVWLIGRAYAAAIERRKEQLEHQYKGGSFYEDVVATEIRRSRIDEWLSFLKEFKEIDEHNIDCILDVHYRVTGLFSGIGLPKKERAASIYAQKRSLASKYLHFHYPNLFFIYDSRAVSAMRKFSKISPTPAYNPKQFDNEYRKFFEKCLSLRNKIRDDHNNRFFSSRHLDNLLLDISRKDRN